jgi:hypothetical protein
LTNQSYEENKLTLDGAGLTATIGADCELEHFLSALSSERFCLMTEATKPTMAKSWKASLKTLDRF